MVFFAKHQSSWEKNDDCHLYRYKQICINLLPNLLVNTWYPAWGIITGTATMTVYIWWCDVIITGAIIIICQVYLNATVYYMSLFVAVST